MTLRNIFLIVLFSLMENSIQSPCVKRISRDASGIIRSRPYREPAPAVRSYDRGIQILTDLQSLQKQEQEQYDHYNLQKQRVDVTKTFVNTPSDFERREVSFGFRNQPPPHHHQSNGEITQSAQYYHSNTESQIGDAGMPYTESGYQYNSPPKNFDHKPYQQPPPFHPPDHNIEYQRNDFNRLQSPTTIRSVTNESSRRRPDQNEQLSNNDRNDDNGRSKSFIKPYTNISEHLPRITTMRNKQHDVQEGDKESENSTENWLSKKQAQNVTTDSNVDNAMNKTDNTKTNVTITLDNRDSFNGGCPSGHKRVNGKCVTPE